MEAVAKQDQALLRHRVTIRRHQLIADEQTETGGTDQGPSPQELLAASLASCTAITMEMYARRKGWDLHDIAVECSFTPAKPGAPTRFGLTMHLPKELSEEQVTRLRTIAAKCPIHRTLDGEVMFDEKVKLK